MKILLLQPEHIYYNRRRTPYFPIGLGYISAVLKKQKHDVTVLDLNAQPKTDAQLAAILKTNKYDLIGISAMSVQYNSVAKLVKLLQQHSKKSIIVLGGALAIHSYKIVLDNIDVDFCVLGEGETILPNLIKNLSKPEQVKGIAYKDRKTKKHVVTAAQEYISDLDQLPFPAWELFPMQTYIAANSSQINLISARGCPFNCNFCSKNFTGVRLRGIKSIVDEIRTLKKKYHVTSFVFDDELVVVNEKRIAALCREIKKLGIEWNCQGRINFATKPILKMMKHAGCTSVGFGIESGSPKILKNMNKHSSPELIIAAVRNCDAVNLNYYPQMIFGYVGEDFSTLKETEKLCFKIGMSPAFNTATPYPQTRLYEWARQQGKIKDELKYLKGLEGNAALYLNCSTFPDDKFNKIKSDFEKKILRNYMIYSMLHPGRIIRDNKTKVIYVRNYVRANGVRKTFAELLRAVKKYPQLVFGRY